MLSQNKPIRVPGKNGVGRGNTTTGEKRRLERRRSELRKEIKEMQELSPDNQYVSFLARRCEILTQQLEKY